MYFLTAYVKSPVCSYLKCLTLYRGLYWKQDYNLKETAQINILKQINCEKNGLFTDERVKTMGLFSALFWVLLTLFLSLVCSSLDEQNVILKEWDINEIMF